MKSLITKLRSFFSPQPSSFSPASTRSLGAAWLAGREDTSNGFAMIHSPLQQSSWVYACVTTLTDTVSSIPFRFVDDKGNPLDPSTLNSQLSTLFDRPHPQLDRFQFWELIVSWLCLRGEAFIYPMDSSSSSSSSIPLSRRVPNSLLILSPDNLHEIVRNGELDGWRYTGSAAADLRPDTSVILPEELIHIKIPNPYNFWRGLSPLTVAWLAAQTDYAAAQFMKGTMINNADTGLIVTSSDQLTNEQVEQISAAIVNRKRGAGSADRPLFVWGNTRVERPTISVVDLQFLENRKFNRQEICAIFKVPQEILGFTEDANRSVSECARLNFMEHRVIPLCRKLESAFQPIITRLAQNHYPDRNLNPNPSQFAVPPSGGHSSIYSSSPESGRTSYTSPIKGEFHVKGTAIMQAAQRERVRTATELFNLGVPMDIINTQLDLGLPALPHGRDSWLPTRVQKVGSLPPPPPEPSTSDLRSQTADPRSNLAAAAPDPIAGCKKALRALDRMKAQGCFQETSVPPATLENGLRQLLPDLRKLNDQLRSKNPNI